MSECLDRMMMILNRYGKEEHEAAENKFLMRRLRDLSSRKRSALIGELVAIAVSFVLIFRAYVPPELKNHLRVL